VRGSADCGTEAAGDCFLTDFGLSIADVVADYYITAPPKSQVAVSNINARVAPLAKQVPGPTSMEMNVARPAKDRQPQKMR
jgi:hypothetical protein